MDQHAGWEEQPCNSTHVVGIIPLMTQAPITDVAANVRAEVARRQIRQTAIAEHLELDQRAVSRRLLGQVEFSASEIKSLADLLQVPIAALYGEVTA